MTMLPKAGILTYWFADRSASKRQENHVTTNLVSKEIALREEEALQQAQAPNPPKYKGDRRIGRQLSIGW